MPTGGLFDYGIFDTAIFDTAEPFDIGYLSVSEGSLPLSASEGNITLSVQEI